MVYLFSLRSRHSLQVLILQTSTVTLRGEWDLVTSALDHKGQLIFDVLDLWKVWQNLQMVMNFITVRSSPTIMLTTMVYVKYA